MRINTEQPDLPDWQTILIAQVVASLKLSYVFPEKINETELSAAIAAQFKEHFITAGYKTEEGIADKAIFAQIVTDILQEIIKDPHVFLSFEPGKIEESNDYLERHGKLPGDLPLGSPEVFSSQEKDEREAKYRADNYGFHDPRGNDKTLIDANDRIGYIGLKVMANPEIFSGVKDEAFRAMQRVQDKDAIIIDLRGNGGGSPKCVQYFLSFFFESPTHINTIKKREERGDWKELQFLTLPKDHLNPGGEQFHDQPVPDLSKKPVYILIDEHTISAGEELAYDMQQLKKATIIGKPSYGGAHPCGPKPLLGPPDEDKATFNKNFLLYLPSATSINPVSGTNWEDEPGKKGVQPHIWADSTDALARAVEEIQKLQMGDEYITGPRATPIPTATVEPETTRRFKDKLEGVMSAKPPIDAKVESEAIEMSSFQTTPKPSGYN